MAALGAPLHPNCYLSPRQFAQKFGLESKSDAEGTDEDEDVSTEWDAEGTDEDADASTEWTDTSGGAIGTSSLGLVTSTSLCGDARPPTTVAATARWLLMLGIFALVLAVGLAALVAFGQIDVLEIAHRIAALAR